MCAEGRGGRWQLQAGWGYRSGPQALGHLGSAPWGCPQHQPPLQVGCGVGWVVVLGCACALQAGAVVWLVWDMCGLGCACGLGSVVQDGPSPQG